MELARSKVGNALNKSKRDLLHGWRQKLFSIYDNQWTRMFYGLLMVIHMGFAIFEFPSYRVTDWSFEAAVKPLLGVELVIITFYAAMTTIKALTRNPGFKNQLVPMLQFAMILAMYADAIIALSGVRIVRFSRFIRPLFFLYEMRALKRATNDTLLTTLALTYKFSLFIVMGIFFAVVGVFLFRERFEAEVKYQNFDTFGYAFLQYWESITMEVSFFSNKIFCPLISLFFQDLS